MHELSIVLHIVKEVEKLADINHVKYVKAVTLEIGEVSMIVNPYMEDCWNWAVNKSEVMKGCKLNIVDIKAVTKCEDCGEEYETVKYAKICPKCKSENTFLLRGNETIIKDIQVLDE